MKKSTSVAIIVTIVFCILCVAFSFFYARIYKPTHSPEVSSSVYIAEGMSKQHAGERVLLAELVEEDFHLYQDGDYTILVHNGGAEVEFDNWSSMIAREKPEMYYIDFNGDNQKELLVRALEGIDENTQEKYYCIYVVFITKDEEGKYKYSISFANRSSWYNSFAELVRMEVSQPKINKKRVQLVMEFSKISIKYDETTGIVKGSRGWYAKALNDGAGNYYTFKDWYLGPGVISLQQDDEGKYYLDVAINLFVAYNEVTDIQNMGKVHCGLTMQGKDFTIMNKSVTFFTDTSCRATTLLKYADKNWQYNSHNTGDYSSSDKVIDNTAYSVILSDQSMNEYSIFSGSNEETKALDSFVLTQDTLKFYAKPGYRFSQETVDKFDYLVTVKVGGVDADITLGAAVGEENGLSTLTFKLDKRYTSEELRNFTVRLGGIAR